MTCKYTVFGDYICIEKFVDVVDNCKDFKDANIFSNNILKYNDKIKNAKNKSDEQQNMRKFLKNYYECNKNDNKTKCLNSKDMNAIVDNDIFLQQCNQCCPSITIDKTKNQTLYKEQEKLRASCINQCITRNCRRICKGNECEKCNKTSSPSIDISLIKDNKCINKYVNNYKCYDPSEMCYNSILNICLEEQEKQANLSKK